VGGGEPSARDWRWYAYREKRGPRYPMLKIRLLDKVGRKGKIKIRFEDGPAPRP
jgi:hypothetical protein